MAQYLTLVGTNYYSLASLSSYLDGKTALTMSCWMKRDRLDRFMTVGRCNDTNKRTQMYWWDSANGNKFVVWLGNGGVTGAQSNASYTDLDTWYHFAFVYDGGGAANADRLKLYVNGAEVVVSYTGTIPATMAAHDVPFRINRQDLASVEGMGHYAELRMWDASLSAYEIKMDYTGRICRINNLIGYWPLNTPPDDTTQPDLSGEGNNASLTGESDYTDHCPVCPPWVMSMPLFYSVPVSGPPVGTMSMMGVGR